jgi:hypothetical protein
MTIFMIILLKPQLRHLFHLHKKKHINVILDIQVIFTRNDKI